MNDREVELQLRTWFRAEVPATEVAPEALRARVATIPRGVAGPIVGFGARQGLALLAAAAALSVIASALLLSVGQSPTPTPEKSPSATPTRPSGTASNAPATVAPSSLGPGLSGADALLFQQIDIAKASSQVFRFDPATNDRILLGTLSGGEGAPSFDLQWSGDRTHVLATAGSHEMHLLERPTAAGRVLKFVCCGPMSAQSWMLSPSGTRAAGIDLSTPDDLVIVVFDSSTNAATRLHMPPGSNSGGVPVAWARDESALFVVSCRPCGIGTEATPSLTVSHEHIDIVPLDGGQIRPMVDTTNVGIGPLAVSPNGSELAAIWQDCGLASSAGFGCDGGQWSVMRISGVDGSRTPMASASRDIAGIWDGVIVDQRWSPDGSRVAFIDRGAGEGGLGPGLFVVSSDGTNLTRLLTGDVAGGAQ
jgi:hypothetical protein